MEPLKVTFDRELKFEGKTFEREAVYGLPQKGQHFVDEGKVMECLFDFKYVVYPILTQKKKVYTVIKVEGDFIPTQVFGCYDNHKQCFVDLVRFEVSKVVE